MGVVLMIGFSIEERAITLAHYIIDSKDTVRVLLRNMAYLSPQYTKMLVKGY